MKETSGNIIAKEQAVTRQAAELFKIWWTGGAWYYTSCDEEISYGGATYRPAAIKRGTTRYDSKVEVSRLDVDIARVLDPAIKYIAMNPVELLWIQVMRVYTDRTPLEASVVFIGQIKTVSFKGLAARAECVGFEFFLRQPIPQDRYSPQCNATLFDSRCKKTTTGFTLTSPVNVSGDKLQVSSALIGTKAAGWFTGGYLVFGAHKRMIANHSGNVAYLRYPMEELYDDATVVLYAGCDGSIQTCKDKFDNVVNFRGHPYVPKDNPTTWE